MTRESCLSAHESESQSAKAVASCDHRPDPCGSPYGCRHKQLLKETLREAIDALEKTRAAFKSKQIEALRKKLLRVLIEES